MFRKLALTTSLAIASFGVVGAAQAGAVNPQPLPPKQSTSIRAVNPQPLPPKETFSLGAVNPQPLPPKAIVTSLDLSVLTSAS